MATDTTDRVAVCHAGTGEATWSMGMLLERLVASAQLGASMITQAPGAASPLHVHTREAEAWFLLDGTMTYRAGGELVRLAAGDFIYLPRGVPHAFRITGEAPARFLALTVPGGVLDLYDEIGEPAPRRGVPDGGVSPADVGRWLAAAPRYGLQVVGPPITEEEA